MRIYACLPPALILIAASASAQSSASVAPPLVHDYTMAHDSRLAIPVVPVHPATQIAPAAQSPIQGLLAKQVVILAQNKPICYAIRSYNFGPDNAGSGLAAPESSSTCVPSKSNQLKSAVVTLRRTVAREPPAHPSNP